MTALVTQCVAARRYDWGACWNQAQAAALLAVHQAAEEAHAQIFIRDTGEESPEQRLVLGTHRADLNAGRERKLREVVLASRREVLCASPFPVGPPVLRILADALSRSHRPVRLVLNEANRPDVAELGGTLSPRVRVQFPFPARPLPKTRLAHTFVFPNDREVFILNSFYRDGDLIADRLQGLWVGDADFVRVQLEAMLENLAEPKPRLRRFPKTA